MSEKLQQPEGFSGPSPDRMPETSAATERRLQRIRDLLAEALEYPDPLAANLGVIGSDLAFLVWCVKDAITRSLAGSASELPVGEIDLLLRITRQLDRLAQVQRHLREEAAAGQRAREASPG
jgi:hypothetical protein